MWTLFTRVVDFKIASRILDNYFLDGEVYVYKVVIALLMLFETQFLKQPRYMIEERLGDMHGKIDEQWLFGIIEDQVLIDGEQFYNELKQ